VKTECTREEDVLEAVNQGRWPEQSDASLREHVAACSVCADLTQVAVLLQEDREGALQDARVPASGLVWWRAQLRARQEAARDAERPIAFVEGIAVACGLGVAFAVLGVASPWFREWTLWVADVLARSIPVRPAIDTLTGAMQGSTLWLVALAAWLVLAPLAIYFTVGDD
jgi:hypothetical protein